MVTNKDLLDNTGYSAQSYVAAWMGGEVGGEWIHAYAHKVALLFTETMATLLIGYTQIQNKNLKIKKKCKL